MNHLSSAEIRLELAEAQAERPKSIVAIVRKRARIALLTNELIERGSF